MRSCLLVIFLLFSLVTQAQIRQFDQFNRSGGNRAQVPEDTELAEEQEEDTVQYGPTTTRFITERDLLYNRTSYQPLDTVPNQIYNYFTPVQRAQNRYQDLGTIGTAARPVFFQFPDTPGRTPGFDAFNLYAKKPEDNRYYNTQSPFINVLGAFGGNGRTVSEVTISRNIGPQLNVSLGFTRYAIDKQLGASNTQGDRRTVSTGIQVHANYTSRNERYRALGFFSWMNHEVEESGGIQPVFNDFNLDDLFEYEDANVWLRNVANSNEIRNYIHFYQEYRLFNELQVYHRFSQNRQDNSFTYVAGGPTDEYFSRFLLRTDTTKDISTFDATVNEAGVKGSINQLYYSFYFKHRFLTFDRPPPAPVNGAIARRQDNEIFAGGRLGLDITEVIRLDGELEYLLPGNFNLDARLQTPLLEARYRSILALPSYLAQGYLGNHNFWINDLESYAANQISGNLKLKTSRVDFRPGLSLTNVNRPVFYERDTLPQSRQSVATQAAGAVQLISPEIYLGLQFLNYFHLDTRAIYTLTSGSARQAYSIPDLFVNSKLYYDRTFLNGKIILHAGLDMHYKSAYSGYEYDIAIQQFFIRRNEEIFGFGQVPQEIRADFFLALKVRNTRIYVRLPQVNQGVPENGYFTHPFYTGQPRVFDIGVDWYFFD